MRKIIAIILLVFAEHTIAASSLYGVYRNHIPISCGTFVSEKDDEYAKNSWKRWLAGYMSASNWLRGRTTDIDMDGIYGWILNYCQQYPLSPAMDAVVMMDREIGSGQHKVDDDKFNTQKK